MAVATIVVQAAIQLPGYTGGGSAVTLLGIVDPIDLGALNPITKVVISSATLNAAIASAFLASGASLS